MLSINEKIKNRRLELGFSDKEVADKLSIPIHSYFDIEAHKDEIFLYPELHHVKKLCDILKMDIFSLLDMTCDFCNGNKNYLTEYSYPRNILINKKRLELGISEESFGDRIGFSKEAVVSMERDSEYLETWPIDYIKDIADVISVPIQVLLNTKCLKCGR